MASFNNDLRLKEINTGAESGTWGTSTNTNLSLVAEAFSFGTEAITTNADTHTTTIADGATDPGRSLYLKYTGALDSDCTITLAPNTVSKVWFIENATTDSGSGGPYNIIISQGSDSSSSNVTIPNGSVMAVYSDGGGDTGNIVSVLTDVVLTDSVKITGTTPTLTIGDGGEEDTKIVFDGNAQDFYLGLDDSDDTLSLGTGSSVGSGERLNISSSEVRLTDGSNLIKINDSDGNGVKVQSDDAIQLVVQRTSNSPAVIAFSTDEISKTAKIEASLSHGIRFYTNNTARFKVKHDGDLDVTNDLRFETNGKGVILTSPDGTKYRISVDNSGNLSTASV